MYKVVINTCFGGFDLSEKAKKLYKEKSGTSFNRSDTPRHDKYLVEVVEELGKEANGTRASLSIEEVESLYRIEEYDGTEDIVTPEEIRWIDPSI